MVSLMERIEGRMQALPNRERLLNWTRVGMAALLLNCLLLLLLGFRLGQVVGERLLG